jgi:sugar phosphate isomerase/epimerase
MMTIGFHTDAFNSANWPFEKCLQWAQRNGVSRIECGMVDGNHYMLGLGYYPHLSLLDDPVPVRRQMDRYGVRFSQIDAAYPLSGEDGPSRDVPYVTRGIAWAAQAGCPCVDTTDGLLRPEGFTDKEALAAMKRSYQQIIRVAEAHEVIVNVEPHGNQGRECGASWRLREMQVQARSKSIFNFEGFARRFRRFLDWHTSKIIPHSADRASSNDCGAPTSLHPQRLWRSGLEELV